MAKKKIDNKISKTADAFMNIAARLGAGTGNILEATEYPLTRLSRNYQLMNSLYRSHWIVRKVIDVIPEDMCKNWFNLSSQIEPGMMDKFNKTSRKLKANILKGMKWGRLYGGAAGIMLIEGHDDYSEPLDLDNVYPDSFKGLLIIDRWNGVYPQPDIITDISDAEFGMPEFYEVTSEAIGTVRVHHSRLIRFIGRDLPYIESVAETYWGASEVEHIYDELKKRDNTSWNIAQLVFLANLRVLKMSDLGEALAISDEKVQQSIYNTIQAQNALMSNQGIYLIDREDGFETHQYSFGGLSDIYENFMLDLSGAAEIPATKLFGRSPAGLNATGESDLQNYYDTIEEKQESSLRPIIDKLLPVICMSVFGAIPDDLDYKFSPVSRPSNQEKVDIGGKHTTAITDTFNSGLISQEIALKELRQMEETTGMWSNITDEDIARADKEFNQQQEMQVLPNVNFDDES